MRGLIPCVLRVVEWGHKAENCHYKISAPARGGADVEIGNSQGERKQKMPEEAEGAFGPWVLVARKWQPARNATKGRSQTSNNAPSPLKRALNSDKADRDSQESAQTSFLNPEFGPNRGQQANKPSSLHRPMYSNKVLGAKPSALSPK